MQPSEYLAQDKFDKTYITSSEIANRLNVTRPAIYFRHRNGHLPNAISVQGNQLTIWERDAIEPHLKKWEAELNSKRAASAE